MPVRYVHLQCVSCVWWCVRLPVNARFTALGKLSHCISEDFAPRSATSLYRLAWPKKLYAH